MPPSVQGYVDPLRGYVLDNDPDTEDIYGPGDAVQSRADRFGLMQILPSDLRLERLALIVDQQNLGILVGGQRDVHQLRPWNGHGKVR